MSGHSHLPAHTTDPDDVGYNTSNNPTFEQILEARMTRRGLLKGSFALVAASFVGTSLTGCGGDDAPAATTTALSLSFNAVAKSVADALTVPTGYTATVLYRLGDAINNTVTTYANDGTDTDFTQRAGDHHDGMHYFGMSNGRYDYTNSSTGLLCMNHENITVPFLHTAAESAALTIDSSGNVTNATRVVSQIDKEVSAHGVSIIEIAKSGGAFQINKSSLYNRRITAATECDITGPAAMDSLMWTKHSTSGGATRGTLNNCANGYTPWGTYLTCEENWAGYFKRPVSSTLSTKAKTSQERYMGSSASQGSYGWANPTGGDLSGTGLYSRWDVTPTGITAFDDYRNAANTFGWVVEVDPFAPLSTPCKRTALGRMGHEGSMPAKVVAGKPIVYYMGDDSRGEYIYKYVSTRNWDTTDANGGLSAGSKYLDDGKLYVAKFAADGTGTWTELNITNTTISGYVTYAFSNQADVLINTRLAADAVGATKMDRPEWTGVHPVTGDVYITLTNNSNRGVSTALDSANPRYYSDTYGNPTTKTNKGNVNGHIIRIAETNAEPASTTFKWDVYLFGAQSDADATSVNVSNLTADNDFSSPDGLWFSSAVPGLAWVQTDDGAYTDVTNCMMLAALPGKQGDGKTTTITNTAVPTNTNANQVVTTYAGAAATTATLRRFLVGPKGCEITGITETPDGKAIFVNIQHPGESTSLANVASNTTANFQSHWPEGGNARPRSATVVITRNDGGKIAV